MSDDERQLPDYLVEAILSQTAPQPAKDVVKNALTWRTISQELLELTYDSRADAAAVRGPADQRSLQFSGSDITMLIEVGDGIVTGQVSPRLDGRVALQFLDRSYEASIDEHAAFRFESVGTGVARIVLEFDGTAVTSVTFVIA